MTQAYPLHWPEGWPRTSIDKKASSRFKTTQERAQRGLLNEIHLLGGTDVIISTNVPIRRDGMLYTNAASRMIADTGVSIYFTLKKEQKCFACDHWYTIAENIWSITKTIEALRGIERWGSSKMVEQAFRGFTALPPPGGTPRRPWNVVLGFDTTVVSLKQCEDAYRRMAMSAHPDNGGNHEFMAELNEAIAHARKAKS